MSLYHKDHRRQARVRRMKRKVAQLAEFEAENKIMNGFYSRARQLERMRTLKFPNTYLNSGQRVNLKEIKLERAVTYEERHASNFIFRENLINMEAAQKLAAHMLKEGMIRKTEVSDPQRNMVYLTWDCLISTDHK